MKHRLPTGDIMLPVTGHRAELRARNPGHASSLKCTADTPCTYPSTFTLRKALPNDSPWSPCSCLCLGATLIMVAYNFSFIYLDKRNFLFLLRSLYRLAGSWFYNLSRRSQPIYRSTLVWITFFLCFHDVPPLFIRKGNQRHLRLDNKNLCQYQCLFSPYCPFVIPHQRSMDGHRHSFNTLAVCGFGLFASSANCRAARFCHGMAGSISVVSRFMPWLSPAKSFQSSDMECPSTGYHRPGVALVPCTFEPD